MQSYNHSLSVQILVFSSCLLNLFMFRFWLEVHIGSEHCTLLLLVQVELTQTTTTTTTTLNVHDIFINHKIKPIFDYILFSQTSFDVSFFLSLSLTPL